MRVEGIQVAEGNSLFINEYYSGVNSKWLDYCERGMLCQMTARTQANKAAKTGAVTWCCMLQSLFNKIIFSRFKFYFFACACGSFVRIYDGDVPA